MQGYNKSTIRIGDDTHAHSPRAFIAFGPDGSAIEFIRSTNNNTWGFGMSEEGIIFGSTANGCSERLHADRQIATTNVSAAGRRN